MNREVMELEILDCIEDDANLQLLYDCWSMIRRAPAQAVEILMQFQDVSNAAKQAALQLQLALDRYDELKPRIVELDEGAKYLREFNRSIVTLDEDKIMNRITRLTNMAKEIQRLKQDGTFEQLSSLLKGTT